MTTSIESMFRSYSEIKVQYPVSIGRRIFGHGGHHYFFVDELGEIQNRPNAKDIFMTCPAVMTRSRFVSLCAIY